MQKIFHDNCEKMDIPGLEYRELLFTDQQLTIAFPAIPDKTCGSSRSRSNTPTCNASIQKWFLLSNSRNLLFKKYMSALLMVFTIKLSTLSLDTCRIKLSCIKKYFMPCKADIWYNLYIYVILNDYAFWIFNLSDLEKVWAFLQFFCIFYWKWQFTQHFLCYKQNDTSHFSKQLLSSNPLINFSV